MILPILNPEIKIGYIFRGSVDGSLMEISDIKEKGLYYSPDGRAIERKETLVIMKDQKTGRSFETNLITAQTLLMERVI